LDRYWLVTWTTYGSWLPGDQRGFVGWNRDQTLQTVIHNQPGTEYDRDMLKLREFSVEHMRAAPIRVDVHQAEVIINQLRETSILRSWKLLAAAVMANHVHAVVGVNGDPDADTILQTLKAYASRSLNRRFGKPENGTWWTRGGSVRKLPDEPGVLAAMLYVRDQEYPVALAVDDLPLGEPPT
jgi:hypothetical protein